MEQTAIQQLKELIAENDRLRAALENISRSVPPIESEYDEEPERLRKIAIDALSGTR